MYPIKDRMFFISTTIRRRLTDHRKFRTDLPFRVRWGEMTQHTTVPNATAFVDSGIKNLEEMTAGTTTASSSSEISQTSARWRLQFGKKLSDVGDLTKSKIGSAFQKKWNESRQRRRRRSWSRKQKEKKKRRSNLQTITTGSQQVRYVWGPGGNMWDCCIGMAGRLAIYNIRFCILYCDTSYMDGQIMVSLMDDVSETGARGNSGRWAASFHFFSSSAVLTMRYDRSRIDGDITFRHNS